MYLLVRDVHELSARSRNDRVIRMIVSFGSNRHFHKKQDAALHRWVGDSAEKQNGTACKPVRQQQNALPYSPILRRREVHRVSRLLLSIVDVGETAVDILSALSSAQCCLRSSSPGRTCADTSKIVDQQVEETSPNRRSALNLRCNDICPYNLTGTYPKASPLLVRRSLTLARPDAPEASHLD